jgi:hypothetical protein
VQVDEDLVELLGGGTYIDTLEKLCNEHNQYVEGRGKGIKFIPTINADMVRGANTDEDVYKCAVQTMAGISIAYDREIERIAECAQTSGTSFWVFGPKQKIKVMQPRSFFNSEKVEVEKELPTVNAAVVLKALEENLLKEAQAKKSSKKTV